MTSAPNSFLSLGQVTFETADDGLPYLARVIAYRIHGSKSAYTVEFIEGPQDGNTKEITETQAD